MATELINLLVQVPLVAVFVWFVLEWSKRNQMAQDRRDEQMRDFFTALRLEDQEHRAQDRAILCELVDETKKLIEKIQEHDLFTKSNAEKKRQAPGAKNAPKVD